MEGGAGLEESGHAVAVVAEPLSLVEGLAACNQSIIAREPQYHFQNIRATNPRCARPGTRVAVRRLRGRSSG